MNQIEVGQQKGILVLKVASPLENSTAEELQESLLECFENKSFKIVINLEDLNEIDAGLLRVLSWASELVMNNKGRIVIATSVPAIFNKMDMVGLDELLEIVPDQEFALELVLNN